MAKFKIWMVALTLIMGVSLTSCFNSEDDNTRGNSLIAKVGSIYGMSYYFTTLDGVTITPTAASIASAEAKGVKMSELDGKIVQIAYSWDASVLEIPNNATKIEGVTLTGIASLDSPVEIVSERGAINDSISDTPIITLEKEASSSSYNKPFYFDETIIVLPINYYLQSKPHSFTLVYYPDENSDGNVKLYLRHKKNGDNVSAGSPLSWNYMATGSLYLYYYAFNLEKIMYNGGEIKEVVVVTEENDNSVDLESTYTQTKEYIVKYETSNN